MLLQRNVTSQIIDREERGLFLKEVISTSGPYPLVMVRKQSVHWEGKTRAPILLVHGFGQNRYAWHLPSRSFANHLAQQGFDVFNVDLRGHGRSRELGGRRINGIIDHIIDDIPKAVAEVSALSGDRPVFLAGHSLGGLVSYAAAARVPDTIAGVAAIGSPYHFARGSLSLTVVSQLYKALSLSRLPLARLGIAISRFGSLLSAMAPFAESPIYPLPWRGWHSGSLERHILDEHLRLAMDHAGLDELAALFELAGHERRDSNGWETFDAFERQNLPLLVIAGSHDDLAPPASVRPGYERSRTSDRTYREFPMGHIDLLVGRDAPLMTWPVLSDWVGSRANVRVRRAAE